jgi:hypothetical protein
MERLRGHRCSSLAQNACRLVDLDQVAIRVTDVGTDFAAVILWLGQEFRAPLANHSRYTLAISARRTSLVTFMITGSRSTRTWPSNSVRAGGSRR